MRRNPPEPTTHSSAVTLTRAFLQSRLGWMALLATVAAVAGFAAFSVDQARARARADIERNLSLMVEQHVGTIRMAVDRHRRSVRFLARLPPIQGIIRASRHGGIDPIDSSTVSQWRARLERIFRSLMRSDPQLLQLRYIGVADGGRELVRVELRNGTIRTVAPAQLQAKGEREYFKAAIRRAPGGVHISPINLNREGGRVQEPHLPVLRFATPVFDSSDEVFGAVVVNLAAESFLKPLHDGALFEHDLFITNVTGDFLAHPDASRVFGFDRGHRYQWDNEFRMLKADGTPEHRVYQRAGRRVLSARQQVEAGDGDPQSAITITATADETSASAHASRTAIAAVAPAILIGGVALAFLYVYWLATRRKLELHEDRNRLAAVVDQSADAILGLDPTGLVRDWNRAATRILGRTAQEAIGRPLHEAVGLAAETTSDLLPSASAPHARTVELECRRRDGTPLTAEMTISPVADSEGRANGASVILRDVTQERADRAQVARMNEVLEREVAERTESLEQARVEAETSNQAKGRFLANMTHEIRTPMNAVLGTLQLLRTTETSAAQARYLTTAEAAAQTLLRTLNDILDFSKIEAHKLQLGHHPFSLDGLLRDLAAVLSANLGSKPVDLVFDVEPGIPTGYVGDSLRLQQVLLNLCGNAIKFTESGSVVLSARYEKLTDGRASLTFCVRDTGIGMTQEQLSRIFTGFEQAEGSTTRRFGGTGLGLAISKYLVELMGGEITVESEPQRGSQFRFRVALELGSESDTPQHERSLARLQGLDVLVVHRPGVGRDALERMCRSMGWSVVSADEVASAKQRQAERGEPFDIVLVNANLGVGTVLALACEQLIVVATPWNQAELCASDSGFQDNLHIVGAPTTASMLFDMVVTLRLGGGAVTSQRPPPDGPSAPLSGVRILLVEDNRMNQEIALALLRKKGAVVSLAANGQAAVDSIESRADGIDVVLMDLHMPLMDGLEATRVVREKLGLGPNRLPIIAMTANASQADREACLAAGMNDHIGKPFEVDHVVNSIRRYVRRGTLLSGEPQERPGDTEPTPEGSGRLDLASLLAAFDDDAELLASIAAQFCERYEGQAERWRTCLQNGECLDALQREMHSLKGLARNLGADQASQLAAVIEGALKAGGDSTALVPQVAALDAALSSAIQALREACARLANSAGVAQSG